MMMGCQPDSSIVASGHSTPNSPLRGGECRLRFDTTIPLRSLVFHGSTATTCGSAALIISIHLDQVPVFT